jgi:hypothetical protein
LLYAQASPQAYQLKCDACLRRHDEARVRGAQGAVSVFAGMTRWGGEACRRERWERIVREMSAAGARDK